MNNYFRLLKYLRPYWIIQLLTVVIMLVSMATSFVWPWFNKILIDDVLLSGDSGRLAFLLLLWGLLFLTTFIFDGIKGFCFTYLDERITIDMRKDLLKKLRQLSYAYTSKVNTGRVMAYFTSDVGALSGLYQTVMVQALESVLRLVVSLTILISIDWQLWLLALPFLPLFVAIPVLFNGPMRNAGKMIKDQNALISEKLQESIAGTREISVFNRELWDIQRLTKTFVDMLPRKVKSTLLGTCSSSIAFFALFGAQMVLMWFGGLKVFSGEMTIGVLIAYLSYMSHVFQPLRSLVGINNKIQTAMGAADRIYDFLDQRPKIVDSLGPTVLDAVHGVVEFKNVSFGYDNETQVLRGVSFVSMPGKLTAIVGPSGAGKSTLASLLLRFHDPSAGSILLDGIDIKNLSLKTLRESVSLVPQDIFLFADTLRTNIEFGLESADEISMAKAAAMARADGFICDMPDKYDTILGERGTRLSGGEKQRIAIARVILRNSRVMVLDEATSSLDSLSEKAIQEAVSFLVADRTVIVIAHRLSTILAADNIVIIDKGTVVDQGSHAALITRCDLYRELCSSQFLAKDNGKDVQNF